MHLQKKVIDFIKERNCWVIKVQMANERGCPDLIACVLGYFLAIEIKEGEDKLSIIQVAQLEAITDSDGVAWVVIDYDSFCTQFKILYSNLSIRKLRDGTKRVKFE